MLPEWKPEIPAAGQELTHGWSRRRGGGQSSRRHLSLPERAPCARPPRFPGMPIPSTATLSASGDGAPWDDTSGGAICSSLLSQGLPGASWPLLHVAHSPGQPPQGPSSSPACCLHPSPPGHRQAIRCLPAGEGALAGTAASGDRAAPPGRCLRAGDVLLSPGLGLSLLKVGRWGRRPPLVAVVSGA